MKSTRIKFLLIIASLPFLGAGCFSNTEKFSFQLPEKNTDWQTLDNTISYREFAVSSDKNDIELIVYKFDSADFTAQITHDQPRRFTQWNTDLGANIIINGAYFDENNSATGWLVIDGEVISEKQYSTSISGMIVIEDGLIDLHDTTQPDSFALTKTFSAVQSFPILIHEGGLPGVSEDSEKIARRTVLAKNTQGEILLIVVDQTPVSLYQLMNGLLASDLEIDIALNLDGGPSTGLIAEFENHQQSIIPLTPLPQVVSFSKRLLVK